MNIRRYLVSGSRGDGERNTILKAEHEHQQGVVTLDDKCWIHTGKIPGEVEANFEVMWNEHPAQRTTLIMHGRTVVTPRWIQSYVRPYFFSGRLHASAPVPEPLMPLFAWAQAYAKDVLATAPFNQMLVNWYENGNDYIGAHADAERDLSPNSPILSVSLGQPRTFRIREGDTGRIVQDVYMPHRSFIVMAGLMQQRYTHEVPPVRGEKGKKMGRRINVTFRTFR